MRTFLRRYHLQQTAPSKVASSITPILKKPTLDKEELSNYRHISNLSVISKIIEHVVKSRLTEHLSSNNLLNPHQSAYCKHNCTETALLYIHDYVINALGCRKYHVSAAFYTIDHNILLSRLSSYINHFIHKIHQLAELFI